MHKHKPKGIPTEIVADIYMHASVHCSPFAECSVEGRCRPGRGETLRQQRRRKRSSSGTMKTSREASRARQADGSCWTAFQRTSTPQRQEPRPTDSLEPPTGTELLPDTPQGCVGDCSWEAGAGSAGDARREVARRANSMCAAQWGGFICLISVKGQRERGSAQVMLTCNMLLDM